MSTNLAVNHYRNLAPQSSSSKQGPLSLTKNGVFNLRNKEQKVTHKDQQLVAQVLSYKLLESGKTKAKFFLSDGVAQINAIVSEALFNKLS